MGWLDPILSTETSPGRTLILCRTGASANAVRRFVAGRGGALGVEIVTPSGLAAALEPNRLLPEEHEDTAFTVPQGHPWETVNDRPGLRGVLAGHLTDIMVEGLDEKDIPEECRDQVAPLLKIDGSATRDIESLRRLQTLATTGTPGKPLGYDRVFAVGFGDSSADLPQPPGTNRFFDRLLTALDARKLSAPAISTNALIDTTVAADVSSEAAWVCQQAHQFCAAGGKPEDVLVLVAGPEDTDRISAALVRSGIPSAIEHSQRLSRHALAVLIESILPWFNAETADATTLDGETLRKVFQSPMTGSAQYSEKEKQILRDQIAGLTKRAPESPDAPDDPTVARAATEDDLWVGRRTVRDALVACHLVKAPLPEWIDALDAVAAAQSHKVTVRRCAILLAQRLRWLRDGHGQRLEHVSTFLNRIGLVTFRDRVAMSIQGAISRAGRRPATTGVLAEVLEGAVSSGDINAGVQIQNYDNYDGRPSGMCLMTGLHSKGIGQAPKPDPFFGDDSLRAWGRIGGAEYVEFLLKQMACAAKRAGAARGCIVKRAADGRAVVPVSHPLLAANRDAPEDSLKNYGLRAATPEDENRHALNVVKKAAPQNATGIGGADAAVHAAMMATTEWIRFGGMYERAATSGPVHNTATLQQVIERDWDDLPPALKPYLGDASAVDGAALPRDAVLSVTGAFEPISHCLFQAFLKTRLGFREAETLEEELNAREVGTAVHKALENVGVDSRWRPASEADRTAAVASLTTELHKLVEQELEGMLGDLPDATPGLDSAREGLRERWNNHLEMYVDGRVKDLETLKEQALDAAYDMACATPEYQELVARIKSRTTTDSHIKHLKQWLALAARAIIEGSDPFAAEMFAHCNRNSIVMVQQLAAEPDVPAKLQELATVLADSEALFQTLAAPMLRGATEWKFGKSRDDAESTELALQLGDESVLVRGSVDRVRVTGNPGGPTGVEIADYKTGKSFAKTLDKKLPAGLYPQLPLYAIALQESIRQGKAPDFLRETPVATRLAYDFVQDHSSAGLKQWEPGAGKPSLAETAALLGWLVGLVRKGQYPVLPHPATCPVINYRGHDYCAYRSVCRFHSHPGTEEVLDEDAGTEDAE